jgi:RimJ/RimL family protein N-acetyltransferase
MHRDEDDVRFFGVPERITLDDGVVIRRYVEDDIPEQVEVINANLEHLGPWMPWAQEPVTADVQLTWFRESDQQWDQGTNFVYGVYDESGSLVGGTGYHVRNGPGVLEIGYWLARAVEGKGLMTRVVDALTKAAASVEGVTRVEIHCDAKNVRSAAIPQRLGYVLVRVEPREIVAPGECGEHLIYAIDV